MPPLDTFYQQLGDRVRQSRHRRGLTQAAVGARLIPPVTRASIANLELGQQRVLAHTLVQLSDVLGVPLDQLLRAAAPDPSDWAAVEIALTAALEIAPARAKRLVRRLGAPA